MEGTSGEGPGGGGSGQQIRVEDLPRLPMEQLRQVKAQVDQELEVLRENLGNLRKAILRLEGAKKAVASYSKRTQGQEVLVPLTGSLYVPGKLGSLDKLIVDIGAAYYVEKSAPETTAYCDRKVAMLKENMEKVVEVLTQKEAIAEKVLGAIQAKMRAVLGGQAQG